MKKATKTARAVKVAKTEKSAKTPKKEISKNTQMKAKVETKKESKSKIQPLGDRVLVREIVSEEKETTTASGIIIPASESGEKGSGSGSGSGSKKGVVIAVGPGRHEDGKIIPVSVKTGDKVLFQWGDRLVLDDHGEVASATSSALDASTLGAKKDDHYLVRESEILAVIK